MSGSGRETRTFVDGGLQLAAGTRLAGRYRVESVLGVGGMGMVYRAHDEKLDVDVALKLLRPELAREPDLVQRMHREVVLARQVSHRNVVRIHDVGQDGELSFLTMDFVAGRSLRQVLEQEGKLEPERAERLVRQIAGGLAAAHAEGVVHRDLSTSNVLVDDEDRAWITDFGLARSVASGAVTRQGVIVGTLDYLSPEQARGETTDARSDLFSLGVILFEMLSGELPFTGETWSEAVAQRMNARPRRLASFGLEIPAPLLRVVERCLRRDPRRRYASADELLADLDGKLPTGRTGMLAPLAGAILLASLLAGLGWLARPGTGDPEGKAKATAEGARLSIAVLPLVDETGRPEWGWIAPALGEQVSETLAELPALRIVAYGRVASAMNDLHLGTRGWNPIEVRQLGELFGAERMVGGVVRSVGSEVQVELRLADANGRELDASARVDVRVAEERVSELAPLLVAELERRLDVQAAVLPGSSGPGISAEGYEAYAQGLAALEVGNALDAVERLEEAVRLDGEFAAAWLRLAQAAALLGREDRARAAAAEASRRIQPEQRRLRLEAEALEARLEGRPERAAELTEELARIYPNDTDLAVEAGQMRGDLGAFDAAERWLARAAAIDSQHPRAWFLRGKFAILAGDPRRAIDDYLVRALVIQNRLRNAQGRADVLNAFGVAYKQLGDLERAEDYYRQGADQRRALGDQRGLATSLRNLAAVAAIRGDHPGAERSLEEALSLLRELGDRAGIADTLNERGVLAEERGEPGKALEDYRQALELRRQLGERRAMAESMNNVGYASFLLGRYADARVYWSQALEIARANGDEEGELLTRQSIAQLDLAQGNWRQATRELLATLGTSRGMEFDAASAVSLGNLATLAACEGRFAAALASYDQAIALLKPLEDDRGLAEYELGKARVWLELGQPRKTLEQIESTAPRLAGGSSEQHAELDALRAAAQAELGRLEPARRAVVEGRQEAERSGNVVVRLEIGLADGVVAWRAGDGVRARSLLEKVVADAVTLDHASLELRAREALATVALALGDPARARRELEAALRRSDRCGHYARSWRLHALMARVEEKGGDPARAELERSAARSELDRVTSMLDGEARMSLEDQELARGLG